MDRKLADLGFQGQVLSIHKQVTLSATHLLVAVLSPLFATHTGSPGRLRADDARTWMSVPFQASSRPLAQCRVELLEGSLYAPPRKPPIDGRLKVEVAADCTMETRGNLSENVCVQHENGRSTVQDGLCENGLASRYKSENTKRLELCFSAVPGRGASELRFERTTLS